MNEAKKAFDPFDPIHRDRRKRRTRQEIELENKSWNERIKMHFERALELMDWPDVLASTHLLNEAAYHEDATLDPRTLRYNTEPILDQFGYEKVLNPGSKDGRWKGQGEVFFVYKRRTYGELTKVDIKQALMIENRTRNRRLSTTIESPSKKI